MNEHRNTGDRGHYINNHQSQFVQVKLPPLTDQHNRIPDGDEEYAYKENFCFRHGREFVAAADLRNGPQDARVFQAFSSCCAKKGSRKHQVCATQIRRVTRRVAECWVRVSESSGVLADSYNGSFATSTPSASANFLRVSGYGLVLSLR